MKNCWLKHLLTDNPNIVGKRSVTFRRTINPLLRKISSIEKGHYNFHVERRAEIPQGECVIFTPTHGFKDDVLYAIRLIDTHAYILFGNLPEFFNSMNGVSAWANGSVLVDREDKSNRKSSILKMERVIEYGSHMLVYPEGRWNHSPNVLVQKLFPGTYDLAKLTGAVVMPIAFHLEGENCYGILDEAFDIRNYGREEGMEVLRDKMATCKWELMEKYSQYKRDDFPRGKALDLCWEDYINSLINQTDYFDREAEKNFYYRKKGEISEEEVFAILDGVELTRDNARVLVLTR